MYDPNVQNVIHDNDRYRVDECDECPDAVIQRFGRPDTVIRVHNATCSVHGHAHLPSPPPPPPRPVRMAGVLVREEDGSETVIRLEPTARQLSEPLDVILRRVAVERAAYRRKVSIALDRILGG